MVQKPAKLRVVSILTFEHLTTTTHASFQIRYHLGVFFDCPLPSRMRLTLSTPIPVNLPRMRQLCALVPVTNSRALSCQNSRPDIAPAPALTALEPCRRICPNSKFVCAT